MLVNRKALWLVGLCLLAPLGARSQGQQIGATVAQGGACPTNTPLQPGVGRYVYQTNNGALCIAGNITTTSSATPPYVGTPLGYQQIVGLSSSTALTVPSGATYALITPETQAVRWRDDGTAPTASVGYPLAVGSQLVYSSGLANIRFIQQSATATLDVSYYK